MPLVLVCNSQTAWKLMRPYTLALLISFSAKYLFMSGALFLSFVLFENGFMICQSTLYIKRTYFLVKICSDFSLNYPAFYDTFGMLTFFNMCVTYWSSLIGS